MAEDRRNDRKPGRPRSGQSGPRRSRPSTPADQRREDLRRSDQRDRRAAAAAERAAARTEEKRRTRFTGRAAILVLVLAVLAVSYASSMRAYLQQRSQINQLQAQIGERSAAIDDLEREMDRWQDDAYVAQQARERFGYVPRGETPYIVIGEDGEPLDVSVELTDPDSVGAPDDAWYGDLWASMEVAGDPPTRIPDPPNEQIKPSESDLAE